MSQFYLMNKDTKVAEFICDSIGIKNVNFTDVYRKELLPIGIRNGLLLSEWLNNRLVLSHRKNIIEMFSSIGIINQEDMLQITKGISLNDTFWVKEVSSKTKWRSVSPYTNPINKEIANYSFSEARFVDGKAISHSADFATPGQFPKCWKRIANDIYLIKGGSRGHALAGNEPFSEIHAYILSKYLQMECIEYKYIKYKGVDATKCKNMCNEEIGIYPLNEVYPDIKSYEELIRYFKNKKSSLCRILDMLLLDYLTLNTDRHFGNISVFVNNSTQQVLGLTPIYDNNLSLLPTYSEVYDKNIENYISGYNGIVTSTGISFDELFRLIDCNYVRNKIHTLKNFEIRSPYKRCAIANQVLQRQLNRIPKR